MGPFIRRIRVRNFKSFADMDLELGRFNVMIGANASGKSNLVQVFRFLRDIRQGGLDKAVAMQGGIQYTRNLRLGGKSTVIEVEVGLSGGVDVPLAVRRKTYVTTGGRWRLEFRAGEGQKIEIVEDSCTFHVSGSARPGPGGFANGGNENHLDSHGHREHVNVTRRDGRLRFGADFDPDLRESLDGYAAGSRLEGEQLLVKSALLEHIFPRIFCFEDIGAYDFDPKLAGESAMMGEMPVLKDDGSNLAVVLKNILADGRGRETLQIVVADMLPFVKSIGARDSGKSAMFAAAEEHLEGTPLPSLLLADGTVSVVALVVALYLEKTGVAVIEEPEKNIHPRLMSKAVDMMKDASEKRQIIITTHSPEIVRYAGLQSLYAVKRGPEGFSEISRPSTNKELAGFLEKDMDLGEMHVQGMLEW